MLEISHSAYQKLRQHGEQTYPNECCGVLLGHFTAEGKRVSRAISVQNARLDSSRHRYEIAPRDIIRIEREARAAGRAIVGFYHSHPDNPAHWSQTDLTEAHWIGCSYVITSVEEGSAKTTHSFDLEGRSEEDKHFDAEEIRILP